MKQQTTCSDTCAQAGSAAGGWPSLKPVLLEGSWDLVSKVIRTLMRIIHIFTFSNPSH